MWPWSKIEKMQDRINDLERDNDALSRTNNRLRSLELSETDKLELDFLQRTIKDYVAYGLETELGWFSVSHRFFGKRTLRDAESDLTSARFYISVLEAQLGPNGIAAAKKVCERLQDLCKTKAIEAKE